jgi:hypothetical protein
MIENVTQGNRRTVEFSLPIGTNDETRPRNIITSIKMRVDSTGLPHIFESSSEGNQEALLKLRFGPERMITRGQEPNNSNVER